MLPKHTRGPRTGTGAEDLPSGSHDNASAARSIKNESLPSGSLRDLKPRSERLKILHLVVRLGAPNTQYNEHCLPLITKRDISICAFFREASLVPPPEIALFDGGGTVRGFMRALNAGLRARQFDVVHAHAPQTGFLLALRNLLALRSMANTIYTVHNCFNNYSVRNQLLLYPVFLAFPRITVCSRSVLESLPRALRLLARSKITIVSNSVDTERVDRALADMERPVADDRFRVVSVSRLIERKDPITLMEAFALASLPDATLTYVGDGELATALAEHGDALGLEKRITFTGMVARDDVYRYAAEADLYMSTSKGEGLPVAVLEAMACGCPVVLSDIAPHREIAEDTDFIPLIPPQDTAGFARAIELFHAMSSGERSAVGRRCREVVEDRFSLWAMHRSYGAIYEEIEDRVRPG